MKDFPISHVWQVLVIDYCDLEFICHLVLEIWNLIFRAVSLANLQPAGLMVAKIVTR
jgi:hypothetical protein